MKSKTLKANVEVKISVEEKMCATVNLNYGGFMGFEKELRYYVAKRKDVDRYLSSTELQILNLLLNKVAVGRFTDKKPILHSVVVESDWPEYELVWDMIQKRIENSESANNRSLDSQEIKD